MELFDRIVNPDLLVRRINLTTNHVVDEETAAKNPAPVQYDLFTDYEALEKEQREEKEKLAKERKVQTAILNIKKQFGKNAILKGLNYEEGATAKERNEQIGGPAAPCFRKASADVHVQPCRPVRTFCRTDRT